MCIYIHILTIPYYKAPCVYVVFWDPALRPASLAGALGPAPRPAAEAHRASSGRASGVAARGQDFFRICMGMYTDIYIYEIYQYIHIYRYMIYV